jgi:mRNA interferase RelE/StbE
MWKVEYTRRFLKELSGLPKEIRARAEIIVFDEMPSSNPFDLGYVERMRGYPGKYKIRLGNYRIGVTIGKGNKTIILQRVANRKDIYKTFP